MSRAEVLRIRVLWFALGGVFMCVVCLAEHLS